MRTATVADLRACVVAGDWAGVVRLAGSLEPDAARNLQEHRRELEEILEIARRRRRELATTLARVQAASGFIRQGFGASPGS